MTIKIITRKTYPFRSFYRGKKRLAFYTINVIGKEPSVTVYSDLIKGALGIKKSDIETNPTSVRNLLRKRLPEDLTEAILNFASKDMKCKPFTFSLKGYVKWREME